MRFAMNQNWVSIKKLQHDQSFYLYLLLNFADNTHAHVFCFVSIIGIISVYGLHFGIQRKQTTPLIMWICYEILSIGYLAFFIITYLMTNFDKFYDDYFPFACQYLIICVALTCLVFELFAMYFGCKVFQIVSAYEINNYVIMMQHKLTIKKDRSAGIFTV